MIKVNSLCKKFGEKTVFKNLTFEIPDSGITVISGPSGIGKTTLVRILLSLEKADSGTVEGLENKRIGVVFQEDRLLPWCTAIENIKCVCTNEKALKLLKKVELLDDRDKKPSELSGGMCRRIALARALGFDGDLLILDEPFKGCDSALRERMALLIKDFSKEKPVILIAHAAWERSLGQKEIKLG